MADMSRRTLLQSAMLALAARPFHGFAADFQHSSQEESQAAVRMQRAFVWTQPEAPTQQVFAAFRKTLMLDNAPDSAILRIFADTRYILWINGRYVVRGPCRFDPKRPEYDLLDAAKYLRSGKNTIAILVHAAAYVTDYTKDDPAKNFALQSARVMAHRPGLAVEVVTPRATYATDSSWRWAVEAQYNPAPPTYSSFYDDIDARREPRDSHGDWTSIDFDDSHWASAVPIDGNTWGPIHPRSIPLLLEEEIPSLKLADARPGILAPGPLGSHLPLELSAGQQIILDCGREVQAYCELYFDAAEGTQIEVHTAVRYFDTQRVLSDAAFPGNTRINRYTARAGEQSYMSTDTFGMKYLGVKVISGRMKLRSLKVIERRYPFTRLGSFTGNDELLNKIWQICANTIELCSEDAHVDCADRERAQWMADGYIVGYGVSRTIFAGPGKGASPRYADSRLLRNMLHHVALSQVSDGRLQPMRPSNYPVDATHGVINDYALLWVQAVAEIYRRDGDIEFARELWPTLIRVLNYYLRRVTDLGLLYASEFVYFNNPLIYVACEGATINAFFHRSLSDAAALAKALHDAPNAARFTTSARQLLAAYNKHLWDEQAGSYRGAIVRNVTVPQDTPPTFSKPNPLPLDADHRTPITGHAAMMALYYEMVPPQNKPRVLAAMQKHLHVEKPFPYSCFFWLDVLYRQDSEEWDREALKLIRTHWAGMTKYETGTTSEDFHGGSFVHEAGALPAYFLNSYVLGVRTEGERASRQIIIDPRLADLDHAEGTTLTEFGPITVRWSRDAQQALRFEIENKASVSATASLRLPSTTASLTVNEKPLLRNGAKQNGAGITSEAHIENGRVRFVLQPGKYTGSLARI